MLGNGEWNAFPQEGTFLSPLQQLRSQSVKPAPSPGPTFMKTRGDGSQEKPNIASFNETTPLSQDSKINFSQQYTVLVANQIQWIHKVNRLLLSSNEVMDAFVTTPHGSATQLRALLMPHFTDIELLLTTALKELLKAQKNLALASAASSVSNTSTGVTLGKQMLNESLASSSEPAIVTPAFPPKQLAKLDLAFHHLNEQFKESSRNPPFNTSTLDTTPSTPIKQAFQYPIHLSEPNATQFMDFPKIQALTSPQTTFPEFPNLQKKHLLSMPDSAFRPGHAQTEHPTPPSSSAFDTSDFFKKLRFSSDPSSTSPCPRPNHTQNDPLAMSPASSAAKLFPATFPAFPMEPASDTQVTDVSANLGRTPYSPSPHHLGLSQTFSEENANASEELTVFEPKPPHSYPDHLQLLQNDLHTYLMTEHEILNLQDNTWVKEVSESMVYHAMAVVRQKWDQSSNQKLDLRTVQQDLKAFSKNHKAAYDYSLNIFAFTICKHIKRAAFLDKSILAICNTLSSLDNLPIRVFSILYMLIPELRALIDLPQNQAYLPPSMVEEMNNNKNNPSNLPIFFAALSINSVFSTTSKYFPFYLNPVFRAAEFHLSQRPAKESASFQFILTILDMASYYLILREPKRMDSIIEVLHQQYDLDEEEFGYQEPDKVWPFFVNKDTWKVEKVVGYYVQYSTEATIRKLNQEALSFALDPDFQVNKKMQLKVKPMLSDIRAEPKWLKRTLRVTKQAFFMFQKEKERAFLASIISVWLLCPDTGVVDIKTLSQQQLIYLCQFLLHIFTNYRVFKIAFLHTLFRLCKLLVPGEFITEDLNPDLVVAYGRFWATLAISISWMGDVNSYFITPIFMLLENIPTHPRSELLASTTLEVSEPVLRRYRPDSLKKLMSTLCEKYPTLHIKYNGPSPSLPSLAPSTFPSTTCAWQSQWSSLQKDIQNINDKNVESVSKKVVEWLELEKSPLETRHSMDALISTILGLTEKWEPLEMEAMALANLSYFLIEKHPTFYASFISRLVEKCPLLNTRIPIAFVDCEEDYLKYLRLIPLFVTLHNNALMMGSTLLKATDLLLWYEHLLRNGVNKQTSDILMFAISVSRNFFSNERFSRYLTYVKDKVVPSLPDTVGKENLVSVLNMIFAQGKRENQ